MPTASHTPARAPRALRRLGAFALGLLAALVLLEVALQVAALGARPEERFASLAPAPGERRIVCIGDSFTYGVHLPANESYPAQLQQLLDRVPEHAWRVVNLGYPGQNSAQVRANLARNIQAYQPEIVIAWIGANNTWSPADRHLWDHPDSEPSAGFFETLVQESRAVGALSMLAHRVRQRRTLAAAAPATLAPTPTPTPTPNSPKPRPREPGPFAAEVKSAASATPGLDGAERGAGVLALDVPTKEQGVPTTRDEVRRGIEIDFARLKAITAAQGAHLVVADYPVLVQGTRRMVNTVLRDTARELGAPCVPLEHGIVPLLAELGRETVWQADNHLTTHGNYEAARLVLQTLMDSGLVEERAEWRGVLTLVEAIGLRGLRLIERSGDQLTVDVHGEPGSTFRIVLLGVAGETAADERTWNVKLADKVADEERTAWFGEIGPEGTTRRTLRLPSIDPGKAGDLRGLRLVPRLLAPGARPFYAINYPGLDLPLAP